MIVNILMAATRAEMLEALRPLGMTYVDDESIEQLKKPPQCGFLELKAVVARAVVDKTDPESHVPVSPEEIKDGYWLLFYANADFPDIEALPELQHKCDLADGGDHSAPVPQLAGITKFDGLPSGVSCKHLLHT